MSEKIPTKTSVEKLADSLLSAKTFGVSDGEISENLERVTSRIKEAVHKAGRNSGVIRILDDKWEFDYVRSQSLIHDEFRFDALLSFIDFYAYVVLGFDFDSYKAFDGTLYFEKAVDIVNKSRGAASGTGW